ncbi:MAG TPA: DUF6580 family putative transport protein [Terriglobales bacterium]|jgi:hypothetical protein|nr:DUF6580 family putative transport protein [Terriglobales bacterium]
MSYVVVLLAVVTRFIPHMPNFSPVFGALLFGGAHLKRRDAIWYPLALLAASDVVLTTIVYRMRIEWTQGITWLGFAAVALIGYWLRKHETIARIGLASVAGPTAFFIISNLGVWIGWRMYPPTWHGLIACYIAALPFYQNSLVASVACTALLFGAYEIYKTRTPERQGWAFW